MEFKKQRQVIHKGSAYFIGERRSGKEDRTIGKECQVMSDGKLRSKKFHNHPAVENEHSRPQGLLTVGTAQSHVMLLNS